jgi:CheY-like chemotaxis protein
MLRRLIGEDIELITLPSPQLAPTKVDRGQIERVIMNLAVNARDAMPSGGKLTVETANAELDKGYAREHFGVTPGPYVVLAVRDTGCGMDAATQARIFEPFFTTKGIGRGTGLGLSTVFGIVQQSGGTIAVDSEPGKGTSFRIYLPRAEDVAANTAARAPDAALRRGSETILLVEDEEQVRTLARSLLQRSGYRVLEARSPGEALLASEQYSGAIHLLLTDVVMPLMSGRQLWHRLAPGRPQMKVLYMSGYTNDEMLVHGLLGSGISLLQKPLTPEGLTERVREVLDSPAAATS